MEELLRKMKENIPCFGIYLTIPSGAIVEMAAMTGYDFLRIDCEHGLLGKGEVREMIRTANHLDMPVFVRVSSLDEISAILDAGADGIIVPDIDSPEKARDAVDRVKYAPAGKRGLISVQRNMRYGKIAPAKYLQKANQQILLCIQIEDRNGVERLDEILKVDGIDMVASGKQDLSQSYGCPGDTTNPAVTAAQNQVIEKAVHYGKIPAILTPGPENMRKLWKQGVSCFLTGFDTTIIRKAMEENLKQFTAPETT